MARVAAGPEIERLIQLLARLPGLGPRSARRAALHLVKKKEQLLGPLATALAETRDTILTCETCGNIDTQSPCTLCRDGARDRSLICVVEEPLDVLALERTGIFSGLYHVLHGALSPIEGIGPENLRVRELVVRVRAGGVSEVILATNPSMEGDYTAAYLRQQLAPLGVRLTRLARGLPVGGDLEYADQNTLLRALSGRQEMD